MIINKTVYKDKLNACWLGKNIGGTIGAPMEFCRQINIIDGYTETFDFPLPNDDLDIQLLWLIMLEEKGIYVNSERLCEYWQRYITPHWSEYGIAKINMKAGMLSPLSGTMNNDMFKHSNGAFIRSEIWACLAPGRPDIAVKYAVLDAIIDHGNGEGTYGEIFCAALESMAFITQDIDFLVKTALSYIPTDCSLVRAVKDAVQCYENNMTLAEARHFMLSKHRGCHAMGKSISEQDVTDGFQDGPIGHDCPLNIGIVLLGLLYGEGSLDKTIKSTIFFGEDTDCTVGTACALFGIMYGTEKFEEKWTKPIGNRIITGCLNLGELGCYGDILPQTVQEFTDRVYKQHLQVAGAYNMLPVSENFDTNKFINKSMTASNALLEFINVSMNSSVFNFEFFSVYVTYVDGNKISSNIAKSLKVTFVNTYKTADILIIKWHLPVSACITPAQSGEIYLSHGGFVNSSKTLDFSITDSSPKKISRYILEISVDGRTTLMFIPVILYNGNY